LSPTRRNEICLCVFFHLLQSTTSFTSVFTIEQKLQRQPFYHNRLHPRQSRRLVSASPTSPSLSTSESSEKSATDSLNLQLYSLLQKVESTGKIAHAYDAESYIKNSTDIVNTVSYNTVISAWGKAAHKFAGGNAKVPMDGLITLGVYNARDAAMRAQIVLDEMTERWEEGESDIAPDNIGFNAAIDAWSKSRVKDAGLRAEELLKKMIKLSRKEDGPQPDTVSFNSVLDAWSHEGSSESIRRAESLLSVMETLDIKASTRTYNSIINVYTKSKQKEQGHVDRILEFVAFLEEGYEQTGDDELKPDVTTFTSAIDSVAHSASHKKGKQALEILKRMENLHNRTKDDAVRPNIRTYTAVINALAWGQGYDAPMQAEKILDDLETREDPDCKPNVWTYTAVINTWGRSRDITKPQRALRILKKMNDAYKATKDESVRPNLFVYNGVIDACARCPAMDKPKQQGEALKIAFAVFKALKQQKRTQANNVTYGLLFKTAKNLLPEGDEREDVVKAVFENCKRDGMVDDGVLRQLRQAAGGELYNELLLGNGMDSDGHVDYWAVPAEWRRGIK